MNVHEERVLPKLPDNWPRLLLIGAFVVVAIIVFARPQEPRAPTQSAPRDDPAAELRADYGGDLSTYRRIFALNDCAALIREHDIALTNEAREVEGTSAAYAAHGYGRAAAQRMIALDC